MSRSSFESKGSDVQLSNDSASFSTDDASIEQVTRVLMDNLDIRDRRYHLKTYTRCFQGDEAVQVLIDQGIASTEDDALMIGNVLMSQHVFHHVTKDHEFKNEALYYRFLDHEESHGRSVADDGQHVSWATFANRIMSFGPDVEGGNRQARLPLPSEDTAIPEHLMHVDVRPLDEYNTALLDNVHPATWEDPVPTGRYNLVAIGAGAGGLVSVAGAAGVGGRVALIESHLLGGDCLNVGCVPSKALIRCANAAHAARTGGEFGVSIRGEVVVDFPAIMERMRRLRAQISPNDSASRFTRELGVDVFFGHGRFTGTNTIEVNGQTLTFSKAVIATGATAAVPPIPGLADTPYLTNSSFFNLTEMPRRLGVIGGGPIGMELAQAMQRLGCQVTVMLRGSRILSKEEPEAAEIVQRQMVADGVEFVFNCTYERIDFEDGKDGEGEFTIQVSTEENGQMTINTDALLVGAGRKPNVTNLGLDEAGVEYDERQGVHVNDSLQTTNRSVYAVGDVCTPYKFTHAADFMARMVIRNALFFGKGKMSKLLIPWATFTEPVVAHTGLYAADLEDRNIAFDTYTRRFDDVDRAILDGETEGYVRVFCKKGGDEILGATIVSPHADNLINEFTIAMQHNIGLGALAAVIHPYPTHGEAVRQAGDQYNKTRLTITVKSLLRQLLALQR